MSNTLNSKKTANKYKSTSTFSSTTSAPVPTTTATTTHTLTSSPNQHKKKLGHREVKNGVVLFKKVPTDELRKSIQFGIVHFINEQNRHGSPYNLDRDVIVQDFEQVETLSYPRDGNASQPAHGYSDFKLKVYAPYGFRYIRKKLSVDEVEFMHAIGETDLIEISNPGASGSVFYKTCNDKFLLKTVQHNEAEFLKSLLPGYVLNLFQLHSNTNFYNHYTLLPRIYGLFCYQKLDIPSLLNDKTNIRIVIMNNILPSDVKFHEKYDLKGSLYKRKANRGERAKSSPTYKDLDFLEMHPDGIQLDEKSYTSVIETLKRDCLILKSFEIMDYSLLLGIHNIDKEKQEEQQQHSTLNRRLEDYYESQINDVTSAQFRPLSSETQIYSNMNNNNNRSTLSSPSFRHQQQQQQQQQQQNLAISHNNGPKRYASVLEKQDTMFTLSAIPATNKSGERLLLYLGIIDILQKYRLTKKVEHALKSIITDGSKISVTNPSFYAERFTDFMENKVFRKVPTFNHSPMRPTKIKTKENSNLSPKINEEDRLDISNMIPDINYKRTNQAMSNTLKDDDQETEETDSGFINNYSSLKSNADRKNSSNTNTLTRRYGIAAAAAADATTHSGTLITSASKQDIKHIDSIDLAQDVKDININIPVEVSKINDVKFTSHQSQSNRKTGNYIQAKVYKEEVMNEDDDDDDEELVTINTQFYPRHNLAESFYSQKNSNKRDVPRHKKSQNESSSILRPNPGSRHDHRARYNYNEDGSIYRSLNNSKLLDHAKFNGQHPFYVVDTVIPIYKDEQNSFRHFDEHTEMYCEIYDKLKTDNVYIIDSYIPKKSLSKNVKRNFDYV